VYRTPSILVTHRLQDAFTMATNVFNESTNQMEPLGKGKTHGQTTFLVLKDGRLVFDGSIAELIHSEDPFLQSFLA
jgi:phospholipid/cholesterol/gamma-HCH transport system ATP-binding protein